MIPDTIARLQSDIRSICTAKGRDNAAVQIVLISKTVSIERIREAYNAGIRDFGENKVQELIQKMPDLPDDIRWHFVGHLQTNKVKYIIDTVSLIQSLDRVKLAAEINKQARRCSRVVDVLIQVNATTEAHKHGAVEHERALLLREVAQMDHLNVRGLMTIGPLTEDIATIRAVFKNVRAFFEQVRSERDRENFCWLSMGMSGDYKIAIEEGANMLRIGSAVFGERDYGSKNI